MLVDFQLLLHMKTLERKCENDPYLSSELGVDEQRQIYECLACVTIAVSCCTNEFDSALTPTPISLLHSIMNSYLPTADSDSRTAVA